MKTILRGANHDHFFTPSPPTTQSNTHLKYVALKYQKRYWTVVGQLFGEQFWPNLRYINVKTIGRRARWTDGRAEGG
jgi:hypothetical protein